MKKDILITFGITILFLVICIQPAIATVEPKASESDDDCNLCAKKVSKSQLIIIKNFLNRLEELINESSTTQKQNPIVDAKYQEFTKRFSFLKEIIMDYMLYWDFPILNLLHLCICSFLFILEISLFSIVFYAWYFEIDHDFPLMNAMIDILDASVYLLNCPGYGPPHSLLRFN